MKKYITFIIAIIFLTSCNNSSNNTIELFSNINGIIPGLTKMQEVQGKFGAPDIIETTKREVTLGIELGGNKIIKYDAIGLTLIFDSDDLDNATVDGVYVESPFNGKSKEGIYLGMPEEECLKIMNQNYVQVDDYGGSYTYARNKSVEDNLQIWFKDGVLITIKLFR